MNFRRIFNEKTPKILGKSQALETLLAIISIKCKYSLRKFYIKLSLWYLTDLIFMSKIYFSARGCFKIQRFPYMAVQLTFTEYSHILFIN